jgi:hypothetical protein
MEKSLALAMEFSLTLRESTDEFKDVADIWDIGLNGGLSTSRRENKRVDRDKI